MNHTITVTLTESAQRKAILSGEPAARIQTYEVPADLLPKLLALPWTAVSEAGEAACICPSTLNWPKGAEETDDPITVGPNYMHTIQSMASGWHREDCAAEIRPATAADAIWYANDAIRVAQEHLVEARAKRRASEAERRESEQRAAAEWSALPLTERAKDVSRGVTGYGGCKLSELAAQAYAEAQAEAKRLQDESDRQRLEQRRAVVAEHGSTEQLGRFDAGVLPAEEFEPLAQRHLFDRFAELPKFVALTESDLDHVVDCPSDAYDDVRFGSTAAERETWDADEWAAITRVRTLAESMDNATISIRAHRAHCRLCEAEIHRYGVRVTIEYAGEKYSQEYAV